MKTIIFTFSLCFSVVCIGQTRDGSFFEKGSVVCFVGNSITHNGEFYHNVLLYHVTRFPDQPLSFYNCGISGDVAGGVLNRMEEDILVHQPTYAVIMLGSNDINRTLYSLNKTFDADTLRRREEAINVYKSKMEKIVNIFLSKNIKVILQKPTIYDQTAVLPGFNNFGANDALKTCCDFIDLLAKKYKLQTVDYWTIMNQISQEMQKKDPSATILGIDRIHPSSAGHLVMAYQFLKSERAPRYVSKIVISKNKDKSSRKSLNCEIKSVSKQKDGMTFTVKENALPFPVAKNQHDGIELVPFMDELNVELLEIRDLKPGQYQLSIDGTIIGVFSDVQLKEGINLAEFKNTPQYCKAYKVREMLEELWQKESALRGIKYIEYNQYFKTFPDKENLDAVKTYIDSIYTVKFNKPNVIAHMGKYVINKPKQKEIEEASDIIRQEVFTLAKPSECLFTLTVR